MTASQDAAAWLDGYVADRESKAALEASTALQSDLAQADAELADARAQLATATTDGTALRAKVTALEADKAALQAALDACQAQQPQPSPTPAPDPTPSTAFGLSVPALSNVAGGRAWGYRTFRKFFTAGLPAKWSDNAVLAAAKPGDTWIISHRGTDQAVVAGFLKSAPVGVTVWLCFWHEPENDNVDKAAYRANQKAHAATVKAAGHKSCLILMGYTSEKGSGRDYRDWYSPEVDAIFWDAYNSGNKATPPVFETPAHILEGLLAIAKETGKPWGITETGAKVNVTASNGFSSRAEWTAAYAQALKDNGALVATWWDQVNASGTFDVRLDQPTADAWR